MPENAEEPHIDDDISSDGTWIVAVGIWNGPLGSSGEWHIKKSGKVVPGRWASLDGPGGC